MSLLAAAVQKVAASPLPTLTPSPSPSPSPSPIAQAAPQIVQVVPDYVVQGLLLLALGAAGWLGSWLHSVLKANRDLSEKVNVLLTLTYGFVAPAAAVVAAAYQAGDIDVSTPLRAVQTGAVVLFFAWLRYNGAKLTKPSQVKTTPLAQDEPVEVAA